MLVVDVGGVWSSHKKMFEGIISNKAGSDDAVARRQVQPGSFFPNKG